MNHVTELQHNPATVTCPFHFPRIPSNQTGNERDTSSITLYSGGMDSCRRLHREDAEVDTERETTQYGVAISTGEFVYDEVENYELRN